MDCFLFLLATWQACYAYRTKAFSGTDLFPIKWCLEWRRRKATLNVRRNSSNLYQTEPYRNLLEALHNVPAFCWLLDWLRVGCVPPSRVTRTWCGGRRFSLVVPCVGSARSKVAATMWQDPTSGGRLWFSFHQNERCETGCGDGTSGCWRKMSLCYFRAVQRLFVMGCSFRGSDRRQAKVTERAYAIFPAWFCMGISFCSCERWVTENVYFCMIESKQFIIYPVSSKQRKLGLLG